LIIAQRVIKTYPFSAIDILIKDYFPVDSRGMKMRPSVAVLLLILFPILQPLAAPIKIDVPIYVPAELPVSGSVCLTSPIARNLTAKLYVDGSFFQEGVADEMGCYKVTIRPLSPGAHKLHAEIFKDGDKVAEIEANVIAIRGMIIVKPQPLAEIMRGETKNVTLTIENRAPLNLSNVALEIEAPFSIFGERMMRVREFAIYGKIGDLPMNGSKDLKLILAVPVNFRPGSYDLKINMTYEIASSKYSILLKDNVVVLNETYVKPTQPPFSAGNVLSQIALPIIAVIVVIVAAILLYIWRRGRGKA
jgi:hypothetical protein